MKLKFLLLHVSVFVLMRDTCLEKKVGKQWHKILITHAVLWNRLNLNWFVTPILLHEKEIYHYIAKMGLQRNIGTLLWIMECYYLYVSVRSQIINCSHNFL